jgi:hypothetical protein
MVGADDDAGINVVYLRQQFEAADFWPDRCADLPSVEMGCGWWPLFVGAEVAPQRLPVWLSAQRGRDLIPGPVGGAGLAHGQRDGLLSDAPGIGRGLDQLFN